MAVGQGVLRAVLDVGALDAVEARLEQHEVARSAAHAGLLRDVLELHRVHTAGGCGLATVAQLALLTRSSEFRAGALLADAQLLAGLPGAPEALDCGLLTVEQARLVCSQLGPLDEPIQLAVWDRLQAALITDDERGGADPGPVAGVADRLGDRGRHRRRRPPAEGRAGRSVGGLPAA